MMSFHGADWLVRDTRRAIRSEPGGPSWRQTIFHPFALTSRHGRGTVLHTPIVAPEYHTSVFGAVPKADAVAVLSDSGDGLRAFEIIDNAVREIEAVLDEER